VIADDPGRRQGFLYRYHKLKQNEMMLAKEGDRSESCQSPASAESAVLRRVRAWRGVCLRACLLGRLSKGLQLLGGLTLRLVNKRCGDAAMRFEQLARRGVQRSRHARARRAAAWQGAKRGARRLQPAFVFGGRRDRQAAFWQVDACLPVRKACGERASM
jgi:hypothetical protein